MDSDELHFLGLCEVGRRIQKRQLSSVDVTKALISRIERLDEALKSYATRTFELALAQANEADRGRASSRSPRPWITSAP
jgi:amidase